MVLAERNMNGHKFDLYTRKNTKEEAEQTRKNLSDTYRYVRITHENEEYRVWVSGFENAGWSPVGMSEHLGRKKYHKEYVEVNKNMARWEKKNAKKYSV